jgi:hypothetical protein
VSSYTTSHPWRKANGSASGLGNGYTPTLNNGASPKGARRWAFQHDLPGVLRAIDKRIAALEGNGHVDQHDGWNHGSQPDKIDRLVQSRVDTALAANAAVIRRNSNEKQ